MVDDIPLDGKQQAMLATDISQEVRRGIDPATGQPTSVNEVYNVTSEDGVTRIGKPQVGESPDQVELYGELWRNEVAAYHVSEALGLDVVPTTAPYQGVKGVGSLQDFAAADGKAFGDYTPIEQERMAVLDYMLANGDRHFGNVMTSASDGLQAIDNGASLPADPSEPMGWIRSDFVTDHIGQSLSPKTVEALNTVDRAALTDQLRAVGKSDVAIEQAFARLDEMAKGKITGKTWMDQGGKWMDSAGTKGVSTDLVNWKPTMEYLMEAYSR